jgi:hypothetical protein
MIEDTVLFQAFRILDKAVKIVIRKGDVRTHLIFPECHISLLADLLITYVICKYMLTSITVVINAWEDQVQRVMTILI